MKEGAPRLEIQPQDLWRPQRLGQRILERVQKKFQVERAALYLFNPSRGDLEVEAAVDLHLLLLVL